MFPSTCDRNFSFSNFTSFSEPRWSICSRRQVASEFLILLPCYNQVFRVFHWYFLTQFCFSLSFHAGTGSSGRHGQLCNVWLHRVQALYKVQKDFRNLKFLVQKFQLFNLIQNRERNALNVSLFHEVPETGCDIELPYRPRPHRQWFAENVGGQDRLLRELLNVWTEYWSGPCKRCRTSRFEMEKKMVLLGTS